MSLISRAYVKGQSCCLTLSEAVLHPEGEACFMRFPSRSGGHGQSRFCRRKGKRTNSVAKDEEASLMGEDLQRNAKETMMMLSLVTGVLVGP
jgi:hypothetical protein